MVEWIREFNRDRPYDDQIRFHGFDAQTSVTTLEETCSMLRAAAVEAAAEPCRELVTLAGPHHPHHPARSERGDVRRSVARARPLGRVSE